MINFYQVFCSGIFKFWSEMLRVEKPDWQSENVVVLDTEAFKLRQFTRRKSRASILILPPQAGHHSCIADYALPGQSLVALCKEHSECTIYAVEWKSAEVSRRHETIDDLVRQMLQCLDLIGGEVHVIGLCQAGWLASICASLYPEKISSLILGGAPIDFTAGGGKLQDTVQNLPMPFYEGLVRLGAGLMDGKFIGTGFKNFNPYDRYVGDYLKLLTNIDDPKVVDRSRRFRAWYEHTQHLSGAWYLQAVYELFKENRLVQGKLKVMGRYVSLKNITCPVVLIAGANDDITLQPQLFNMARHVSGKVLKMVIPDCGHIGLFMKKQALEGYWKRALGFVFRGTSRELMPHDTKVVYMSERKSLTQGAQE
ncbi:MAG: alpha/beta fold hydrolase [Deltaproteobacteria bacterium]